MKLGLLIFGITGFLIVNTYYDGKYTKILQLGHKYFKMAMFGFVGLSIYLFIKKNPDESKTLLSHANDIIRYMPIDRNTADMVSPFFNFTSVQQKLASANVAPQTKRMMNSGRTGQSRSVSETKKKYKASQQNWKCAHCGQQLKAKFSGGSYNKISGWRNKSH